MSSHLPPENDLPFALRTDVGRWKRWLIAMLVPVVAAVVIFLMLWNSFFRYVPPGKMLVMISKMGKDLPAGKVLADTGEKGIQRAVLGEGWHLVWPVLYTSELKDNILVEPGKVGLVTSLDGKPLTDGRVLAEEGEQGIRRNVLPPGAYRLNPYGYKVEVVPAVQIAPGFIGVKRRLLGNDGQSQFAEKDDEKGIVKKDLLEPGLYYLNPKEYEVLPGEIGVDQITYHYDRDNPKNNSAITFPAKDGNSISLECTIEWEVLPEHWPDLLAKYGDLKTIKQIVVDQHARKICRDRGFNYGAQDFLDGAKREKFQTDFRTELDKICTVDNVRIRSAFIRNIVIPDNFLEQKRLEQLAVETQITSKALTVTAESQAAVQKAKSMIAQRERQVEAETARMVGVIERDTLNVTLQLDADIDRLKAEYGKKIAAQEAERSQLLGEAKAQVVELKKTAESSLYRMKMDVFNKDGEAYLRYSMAQELNPNLRLRLFQAGAGTLWTNLGEKNANLFMNLPAGAAKTEEVKPAEKK